MPGGSDGLPDAQKGKTLENEKAVLVGIDLTDDFTQLCYYTEESELFSASLSKDPAKFRIPTELCAFSGGSDWLFGEEAASYAPLPGHNEEFRRINGLVSLACSNGTMEIFGQTYAADILLERFFRRMFAAFKAKFSVAKITGVVFTVKSIDENLKRNLTSAVELLGIRSDRIRMITHLESFMYYSVSQNKDIWINDVGLFDFDHDEFVFYKLSFGRRSEPITVVAEKTDLTSKVNYKMLAPEETDRLMFAFENTASAVLNKQIISGLYFTGAGFESAWADNILKNLCNGRRVFRGQNLYVKGAGYAADLLLNGGAQNYLLVGDRVLKSSIAIRALSGGSYQEKELVSIGQLCDEAACGIEVIMDKTNELDFIVHNALKKDFICAIVTLETLNVRPDRSVRLNIRLRFPDRDTCVITVRDMGFGEIYRSNHKIWEQVLKI